MASGAGHEITLQPATVLGLREPLRRDHDTAHPDRSALLDRLEARVRTQGDHGEVDCAGDVLDPCMGGMSAQLEGIAGDDVDRP